MTNIVHPTKLYLIGNTFYYKRNFKEAVRRYFLAAEKYHGPSQQMTGYMNQYGLGCDINYGLAMSYYKKARENGNIKAITSIGYLYEHGLGVDQCYYKAYTFYKEAADKGEMHAMYNLGVLVEGGFLHQKNIKEAKEWYQKAIDHGLKPAKRNLEELLNREKEQRNYSSGNFDKPSSNKAIASSTYNSRNVITFT